MMQTVDARGLACPEPVILAKKALARAEGEEVLVLVDNPDAAINLTRLGESQGRGTRQRQVGEREYEVLFAGEAEAQAPEDAEKAYVLVLSSNEMGAGDAALGRKLMEGFLYALTEQRRLPAYILCYNKGVELTTVNEKTAGDLKALAARGVEVLSCGLCLDYYGLKESLQVGQVSNMYRICELMSSYPVIRP